MTPHEIAKSLTRAQRLMVAAQREHSSRPVAELVFTNSDARPKVTAMIVDWQAVPAIMAWYGAFYAGDRYFVTFDGKRIAKDQNGEPVDAAEFEKGSADA